MCECKNTLWTFILTPTGILPNTEYLSRLQLHAGDKAWEVRKSTGFETQGRRHQKSQT